jgi:hypothetical protein
LYLAGKKELKKAVKTVELRVADLEAMSVVS